jgi:CDGSH-type Zn-finger protein
MAVTREAYELRERHKLCRCGGSRNKTLCDVTHWSIGFKHGAGEGAASG